MIPEEDQIAIVVQDVWQTTLGMPIDRVVALEAGMPEGPSIDGVVAITGDWAGAVVVQVSRPLAEQVARIMFKLGDAAVSADDLQDAFGEITNIAGGNVKGLFDGHCHLGLPTVVEGADYRIRIPSAEIIAQARFRSGAEPVVVTLVGAR